jgi:hypothetical protein
MEIRKKPHASPIRPSKKEWSVRVCHHRIGDFLFCVNGLWLKVGCVKAVSEAQPTTRIGKRLMPK